MTGEPLSLRVLEDQFTIHRLGPDHVVPARVYAGRFFSITRTEKELSVVCSSSIPINSRRQEPGWSCIQVRGPLDFAETGILAGLATALAEAGISIFAVSTFDTDYILVREKDLSAAIKRLRDAGYNC